MPTPNRCFPARGGCAVGGSPGILAAAGGESESAGSLRLPAPLHPVNPVNEQTGQRNYVIDLFW